MANLSGSMSSVGGVNLDTEAAIKYSEMATAAKAALTLEMPLLYGFVSQWDWFAEMLPCAVVDLSRTAEYAIVKGTLEKPEPTEDDRKLISSFLDNSTFDITKHPNAAKAWGAFKKYNLTSPSPFFKSSQSVYGWPNTQVNDPRRTGKVIVFKDVSKSLEWLLENSYKYGFVWYGPSDETFIYVGQLATFSDDFKAAASMGLKAPIYRIYKQAKGKAPASKQEIVDWVKDIPATGYANGSTIIPQTSLTKGWIAWELFMELAQ